HGAVFAFVPIGVGVAAIGDGDSYDAIPRLVVVMAGECVIAGALGIEVVLTTLGAPWKLWGLPPLVGPLEIVAPGQERKAGAVAELLPAPPHPVCVRSDHILPGDLGSLAADPHGVGAAPFRDEQGSLDLLAFDEELLVLKW